LTLTTDIKPCVWRVECKASAIIDVRAKSLEDAIDGAEEHFRVEMYEHGIADFQDESTWTVVPDDTPQDIDLLDEDHQEQADDDD
jgi:hypothetical protein